MELHRLGRAFSPTGDQPWAKSHASTPFAAEAPDGRVEVTYSSRDALNRSHICSLMLERHGKTFRPSGEPRLLLSPGAPGTFDEHGLSVGSVMELDQTTYLYYVGWSLRTEVPWQNTIGLAVRAAGEESFHKVPGNPVLDTSPTDPYSLSYPWVRMVEGQLVMFYGTNLSWGRTPVDMEHAIRRAVSTDGIHWERDTSLSVDVRRPDEYALARPGVWTRGSTSYMLLSSRTRSCPESYSLALARSDDGVTWKRVDRLLVQGAPSGPWDAEMTCYAAPFKFGDDLFVVYCGNGFGKTGFGLATITE